VRGTRSVQSLVARLMARSTAVGILFAACLAPQEAAKVGAEIPDAGQIRNASARARIETILRRDGSYDRLSLGIVDRYGHLINRDEIIDKMARDAEVFEYPDGSVGSAPPAGPFHPELNEAQPEPPALPEVLDPTQIENDSGPIRRVIGSTDSRFRVQPTTRYEPNATGLLYTTDGPIEFIPCSGTVYGHQWVVTAAHCIHSSGPTGHWYYPTNFTRGQDGSYWPYSTCTPSEWYVLGGWVSGGDHVEDDMAWFKINCYVPGTFGDGIYPLVAKQCSCSFVNSYVTGYPVYGPTGADVWGEQWSMVEKVTLNHATYATYPHDTTLGQSGGTVAVPCLADSFRYCEVAVHKGEYSSSNNWGHRFVNADITVLAAYRGPGG
jgi:V8-like Glu-specific endopeptidase